jgi:predicted nucleic acid-binding protein
LVQLLQFSACSGFEADETRDALPIEQRFGVGALERLDHGRIVTLRMINVKRDYWPCADPDDDSLECALTARADYIVSGDRQSCQYLLSN